jgi:S-adenosylmethionine:tRNA ribosyltransferase-isomerase
VEVPDYDLPVEAIAQTPLPRRDSARLLDATGPGASVAHRRVSDLPELLGEGDVLVVNSSRVIPARLLLRKATGGAAEALLLEPSRESPGEWSALVRPGRRLPPGTILIAADSTEPVVEVGERLPGGVRRVRFLVDEAELLERHGALALPPYIHSSLTDPERYQTVYAERAGSVAAPTAGLHLTREVLAACRERGVEVRSVDLAVGLATFRPITATAVSDHVMHEEQYTVPEETWAACRAARRVVAIGTTTVRALESVAATGRCSGRTSLFISPGYPFAVVDVLMTNFHQPRSSLLVMLEAFAGGRWRDLYREALAEGYRFLSFGDAMLVARR